MLDDFIFSNKKPFIKLYNGVVVVVEEFNDCFKFGKILDDN